MRWLCLLWLVACVSEVGPLGPKDSGTVMAMDAGEQVTCSSANGARHGATASYIAERDRIVVLGGARIQDGSLDFPRLVELIDPTTLAVTEVAELRLGYARSGHTTTVLPYGRILVAGGEAFVQLARISLRSAFLLDARWDLALAGDAAMSDARTDHDAVRLPDDRVLLIGGRILRSDAVNPRDHEYLTGVELYDPVVNRFWSSAPLSVPRAAHSATLVGGMVVVAGGMNSNGPVTSIELIDVSGPDPVPLGVVSTMGAGPIDHAAMRLGEDSLVLSGGFESEDGTGASSIVEIWTLGPAGIVNTCVASLAEPRGAHTMTDLDGEALIAGGRNASGELSSVEQLVDVAGCGVAPVTEGCAARAEHAAARVGDRVVLVGGRRSSPAPFGESIDSVEVVELE